MEELRFRALVSSDWNECLSPARPFDILTFVYPQLEEVVEETFLLYTGNRLSYSGAVERLRARLPRPITQEEVDRYLHEKFSLYTGTQELIRWCRENRILFMINTTGWFGYFQRAFAASLIPAVDCLSASTFLVFDQPFPTSCHYPLEEIEDKPKNTAYVMERYSIEKVVIIGDSGGDGPHFEWGRGIGALLIGSMTKLSLERYCSMRNISIDVKVGDGESIEVEKIVAAIESFL